MIRYSLIKEKFPREFLLLQGTGCRWGKCTFCDYHTDTGADPFQINEHVLKQVTGEYGVLDIINSGSCTELDEETLNLISEVIRNKSIRTVWFEAHWMYRNELPSFARRFPEAEVKFRTGAESFDPELRTALKKGISESVTAEDIAAHFQGVCLLACISGQTKDTVSNDIKLASEHFEYFSINIFNENSTDIKRDDSAAEWLIKTWHETLKDNPKAELLVLNTDLGVGDSI